MKLGLTQFQNTQQLYVCKLHSPFPRLNLKFKQIIQFEQFRTFIQLRQFIFGLFYNQVGCCKLNKLGCKYSQLQIIKIQTKMSQQMKANLLIHIQTNRSFIEEKVYDQFKYECLKDDELKDLDVGKMIKVIKQIFDFGQNNQYMNIFFQRAPDSIHNYIASQYKKTNETEDLTIDINKLIDVIYACVEEGFPKDQPKIHKQDHKIISIPQEIEQKKHKIIQAPKQQVIEPPQKVRKFIVPKPKTPEKKNFLQKFQMPQKKQPARYLMHVIKQTKKQEQQPPIIPDVEPIDLSFIQKNKQAIQTRLLDLYRHYCAQQQNVGKHTTFDRIKQQCQQMTIGKFLLFCKTVKIFQQKDLGKQNLSNKFKKIAEGKKEVQFDKFKQLLSLVDAEYIKIKQKKLGQEAVIPTYEARLMLQGNQYKKLKKDVDLPFQTRQKEGRELKIYSTLQSSRYSKKDQLTGHSGKFGKDLKEEIQRKLLSQSSHHKVNKKSSKNKDRSGMSAQKNKIIRLDNLKYQNLPQMQWILHEDERDKTFMKQYRARDVVGQLKKRVNDLQKLQSNKIF